MVPVASILLELEISSVQSRFTNLNDPNTMASKLYSIHNVRQDELQFVRPKSAYSERRPSFLRIDILILIEFHIAHLGISEQINWKGLLRVRTDINTKKNRYGRETSCYRSTSKIVASCSLLLV